VFGFKERHSAVVIESSVDAGVIAGSAAGSVRGLMPGETKPGSLNAGWVSGIVEQGERS